MACTAAPLVTGIEIQGIFTHSVFWEKQPRNLSVMDMSLEIYDPYTEKYPAAPS